MNEIVAKDAEAIIQVDVPLLIEQNLQYLFHKILVVYVPEDKQVKRLVERDGIRKEEAINRLRAQLSIEEKVGYADFVIYNDRSLEETRKQVKELWEKLKEIQKERIK